MIKQSITYTDYNDEEQTEEVYFHISKAELFDHLDLKDKFEVIAIGIAGDQRTLTEDEVREILALIKELMHLGYGIRSEDGKRFHKSEKIWDDFASSAAYDATLMAMFTDTDKALAFLTGVMPKDLMKQAQDEIDANGGLPPGIKLPQDRQPKHAAVKPEEVSTETETVEFDGDVQSEEEAEKAALLARIAELEAAGQPISGG